MEIELFKRKLLYQSAFWEESADRIQTLFVTQINRKPLAEIACNVTAVLTDQFIHSYIMLYYFFLKEGRLTPLNLTILGFILEYNESFMGDVKKVVNFSYFEFYLMAAEQSFPLAQYFIGRCYLCYVKGADKIKLAIEFFEKAASSGNPRAQFEMGVYYEHCKGDLRKALYWYTQSGKNGFYKAQSTLGELYKSEEQHGVTRDIHMAIHFFRRSIHKEKKICSQLFEIFKHPHTLEEDFSRW